MDAWKCSINVPKRDKNSNTQIETESDSETKQPPAQHKCPQSTVKTGGNALRDNKYIDIIWDATRNNLFDIPDKQRTGNSNDNGKHYKHTASPALKYSNCIEKVVIRFSQQTHVLINSTQKDESTLFSECENEETYRNQRRSFTHQAFYLCCKRISIVTLSHSLL